jgi:O-methyltransferase
LRWKTGDLSMPLEVARRNLAGLAHVSLLPGWIPSRFAEVAHRRFCFVHLDVDLYQPTLDSLDFFYERVVPGGILLCDDYGSSACPGAKRACDEFAASRPERRWVHLTSGQGFLVKR